MKKLSPARALAVVSLLIVCSGATDARAADLFGHNRTTHDIGFLLGLHGDPAPSGVGLNVAANLKEFIQIHGGAGTYNGWVKDTGTYSAGALVKVITFPFAWAGYGLGRLLKTGHVDKHLRWKEHMPLKPSEARSITSYGGGAKLFVPGWNLSPTAGVAWAHYETFNHPDHLADRGSHIYYTAGADYMASTGFSLGSGVNICPGLKNRWCGFYVSIGALR